MFVPRKMLQVSPREMSVDLWQWSRRRAKDPPTFQDTWDTWVKINTPGKFHTFFQNLMHFLWHKHTHFASSYQTLAPVPTAWVTCAPTCSCCLLSFSGSSCFCGRNRSPIWALYTYILRHGWIVRWRWPSISFSGGRLANLNITFWSCWAIRPWNCGEMNIQMG